MNTYQPNQREHHSGGSVESVYSDVRKSLSQPQSSSQCKLLPSISQTVEHQERKVYDISSNGKAGLANRRHMPGETEVNHPFLTLLIKHVCCTPISQQCLLTTIRQAIFFTGDQSRKFVSVYEERDDALIWCTVCKMDVSKSNDHNNSEPHRSGLRLAGILLLSDRDPYHCHTCGQSFYIRSLRRHRLSARHVKYELKGNFRR